MRTSLTRFELCAYLCRQMGNMFPDGAALGNLAHVVGLALERTAHCFSRVGLKGFTDAEGAIFSHRHSDQYAIFLYYLANSAFQAGNIVLAEKTYALNKALHGLDAFYEVELPAIFAVQHPVGTVLGRATYSDYFLCYQNCTVGANLEGEHPSFGEGVVMYGGSRIIGDTHVGSNTLVSTGAIVIDSGNIQPDAILHGVYPDWRRSANRRNVVNDIFRPAARACLTAA
jgi:serine O-acetyltransferase